MRRPNWRSAMFAAASGIVGLSILAGCTSRQNGLSASDQTARYLQSARGRYPVPGTASDPWGPYIHEASTRFDMPETWIRALMRQESGGNLYRGGRLITSSAGAMGLMQVMPGTYSELRARHRLGPDPFEPHDNIMAGVGYMREMYDMYGAPGFLAAYNAGPNRLDDYLSNQRGLPDETRKYVASIGPSLRQASPRVHSPAEQFAMNQVPLHIPAGPRFGYGSVQVPAVQMAAAAPVYTPRPVAVAFAAPVQTFYTPPPAPPRAVAWAEPPRPVYTPAPVAQAPVIAFTAPAQAAPVLAAPVLAAPVLAAPALRPVAVARVEEERDEEPARRMRVAHTRHPTSQSRLALIMPPSPPMHKSGGGFHLISSAMAAESFTVRRGTRGHAVPAVARADKAHAKPAVWKLHATGAAPSCAKGKSGCGPNRLR